MRVLYLIDTLQPGGSEQSLLDILSQPTNIQPLVCSIYQGNQLRSSFESNRIPVLSLNLAEKYGFGKAISRISHLLKSESFDLIHATLARANLVGRYTAKHAKLPMISSLVNESYSEARLNSMSPLRKKKLQFVKRVDRWTAPWVTHFIANSEAVKNAYCKDLSISDKKVTVIYRGRDAERFNQISEQEIHDLRASLGLQKQEKIILNVARLVQQKGHLNILDAFSIVRKRFNEARLILAGEGPLREQIQSRIRKLQLENAVLLLGYRSDVPQLLRVADLFVFPSQYEGHPGSLVEAMISGCPIVASDIVVHRETLTEEKTGLMVPCDAPEILAGAILKILENPETAKCMGSRAAAEARERFDIRKTASLHEQLYASLLGRTPVSSAGSLI